MLIRAKEHVNEHGGNDADVRLFGQGTNFRRLGHRPA
jgi:hypothetical protein